MSGPVSAGRSGTETLPFQAAPSQRIVLVGAGHTNLHVVRMWLSAAIPGARLTLVSAGSQAAYSGMLPGTLAGLYQPEEMLIDLHQLTNAADVELIVDSAIAVDAHVRTIAFRERPAIRYDICSIGIGSMPRHAAWLAQHPGFVSIKPMHSALSRLESALASSTSSTIRVAVIGGGAAGVEIAFSITARLTAAGRQPKVTLIDAQPTPVSGFRNRTVRLVQRELRLRNIQTLCNHRAIGNDGLDVLLDNGSRLTSDIVLWVTGAAPPELLAGMQLPKSPSGFLSVRRTLQSTTDDRVFAVGDSAEIVDEQIDRAGVYAVRQGPVLWENLQHVVNGGSPIDYRPQRDFLRLLSTGDGCAIAQWRWFSAFGSRWWRLKDRIDSRFMQLHRPGQRMTVDRFAMPAVNRSPTMLNRRAASAASHPMRCRGCGGKTSSRVLSSVLQRLRQERPAVPEGFLQSDDIALLPASGLAANAVSVDFFPAFLEDSWLMGRIAAIHALSDLWASGAQPSSAVAMITLPSGSPERQAEQLYHVLSGAIRELEAAGAVLTTGHTTDGDQLSVGFTVLGHASDDQLMKKAGLRPGQALILTKPLGTGVILAARDQGRGTAKSVDAAIQMMLRPNASAAHIALKMGVTAATDVTGFGLAGHLSEMMMQSGVSAELSLKKIPFLPGTIELCRQGIHSSLYDDNQAAVADLLNCSPGMRNSSAVSTETLEESSPELAALFDPQTSGGLLIAIDSDRAEQLSETLRAAGDQAAIVIGRVTARTEIPQLILRW